MSKVTVNINEVIAKVEEAYEEVRKTSKIVLQDFHRVKPLLMNIVESIVILFSKLAIIIQKKIEVIIMMKKVIIMNQNIVTCRCL